MDREALMNLLSQIAYLDKPQEEELPRGQKIETVQDIAQYYIDNPDKLYQQDNNTVIPCMMSEGEWIKRLPLLRRKKEFEEKPMVCTYGFLRYNGIKIRKLRSVERNTYL